jgi:hypothetical protein
MKRNLLGILVSGAAIAGLSLIVVPAAAETPLAKEMGKKWGDKCAPIEHAVTCCYAQRNGETACKNLERERTGSPVVRNCDDAEKICQSMVRSAEEAKKKPPQQVTLPTARQAADNWQKQLEQAEDDYIVAMDAAKNAKTKPEIERALRRADDAKKKIDSLKRRMGDLSPAERIPYTSKLPPAYVAKNPFDLIYDSISRKLCGRGKAQWDGTIVSCQFGDNPSENERPIPPATDVDPKDPNGHR